MSTSFFVNSASSTDNAKSIPIHCVVESFKSESDYDVTSAASSITPVVERDTYVIVPGQTPFADLIRIALVRIGYSLVEGFAARGYVELKNWKRLPVDVITDNACATVEEVLGDLVPMATVCIRLCNSCHTENRVREVQEKMLSFLFTCCPTVFSCAGCPLNDRQLSAIVQGDYAAELTENQLVAFRSWHSALAALSSSTAASDSHGLAFSNAIFSTTDVVSPSISGNARRIGQSGSADEPDEPPRWFLQGVRQTDSTNRDATASDHSRGRGTPWISAEHNDVDVEEKKNTQATRRRVRSSRSRSGSRSSSVASARSCSSDEKNVVGSQTKMVQLKVTTTKEDVDEDAVLVDDDGGGNEVTGLDSHQREASANVKSTKRGTDRSSEKRDHSVSSNARRLYNYNRHHHQHHHHHHHLNRHRDYNQHLNYQHDQQASHRCNNSNSNYDDASPHYGRKTSPTRHCADGRKTPPTRHCADREPATHHPSGLRKSSPEVTVSIGVRQSRDVRSPLDDNNDVDSGDVPEYTLTRRRRSPPGEFSRTTDSVGLNQSHRSSTLSPINAGRRRPEAELERCASSMSSYRQSLSLPLVDTPGSIYRAAGVASPVDCPLPSQLPPDLVHHLREQQALRLAAVSRALQQQLRYLHHSSSGASNGSPAGGSTSPSSAAAASAAAVAAAALYYKHQPHAQHLPSFDAPTCHLGYGPGLNGASRLQLRQSGTSMATLRGLMDAGSSSVLHSYDQLPVSHHHNHQHQQHRSAGFFADLHALNAAAAGRAISPTDSDNSMENGSGCAGVNGMDRRKRSRVFIDPLTEIPRLERWFADDTHPSAYTIEQYTAELNGAPYRQRFPPLEPKNVQLWFKNHRAKVKRQKLELQSGMNNGGGPGHVQGLTDLRMMGESNWRTPDHCAAETG